MLGIAGLATACGGGGGPSVASLGSATPSADASDSTTTGTASPLAYATCMRAHGVSAFPDPDQDGGFAIEMKPGTTLDSNSPVYRAAARACQGLMPSKPTEKQSEQMKKDNLALASCMRSHGIKDFPDPDASGQITLGTGGDDSDLSPDNPQFKRAMRACQKSGSGSSVSGSQGGH
ncbi:MAG: hypothetical protein QM638_22515 [Nocardioides sp.]|uniref:hypothetical protein n=1 Tax=Nocardioides sp. TaxID=35761 RepID=UPI0039E34518